MDRITRFWPYFPDTRRPVTVHLDSLDPLMGFIPDEDLQALHQILVYAYLCNLGLGGELCRHMLERKNYFGSQHRNQILLNLPIWYGKGSHAEAAMSYADYKFIWPCYDFPNGLATIVASAASHLEDMLREAELYNNQDLGLPAIFEQEGVTYNDVAEAYLTMEQIHVTYTLMIKIQSAIIGGQGEGMLDALNEVDQRLQTLGVRDWYMQQGQYAQVDRPVTAGEVASLRSLMNDMQMNDDGDRPVRDEGEQDLEDDLRRQVVEKEEEKEQQGELDSLLQSARRMQLSGIEETGAL